MDLWIWEKSLAGTGEGRGNIRREEMGWKGEDRRNSEEGTGGVHPPRFITASSRMLLNDGNCSKSIAVRAQLPNLAQSHKACAYSWRRTGYAVITCDIIVQRIELLDFYQSTSVSARLLLSPG